MNSFNWGSRPVALFDAVEAQLAGHVRDPWDAPLSTGLVALDNILGGGIWRGELTVVAGPTGVGSTTLALGLAGAVALKQPRTALVVSADHRPAEMGEAFLSALAKVPRNRLRTDELTDADRAKLRGVQDRVLVAQLQLDCLEVADNDMFGALAADLPTQPDLAVLDNASAHFSGDADARIWRSIRAWARLHECALVVTASLPVLPSEDRRTLDLGDLHVYPGLAQVADNVLLLHRPDLSDPTSTRPGEADVDIAKQRRGRIGRVRLGFQGHFARFVDLSPAANIPAPAKGETST